MNRAESIASFVVAVLDKGIGTFCFYVSFEDDLMRNFGASSRMTKIMETFGLKEGEELEHP